MGWPMQFGELRNWIQVRRLKSWQNSEIWMYTHPKTNMLVGRLSFPLEKAPFTGDMLVSGGVIHLYPFVTLIFEIQINWINSNMILHQDSSDFWRCLPNEKNNSISSRFFRHFWGFKPTPLRLDSSKLHLWWVPWSSFGSSESLGIWWRGWR